MVLKTRTELSKILHEIPGVQGVYFASAPALNMKYPCIRYALDNINVSHADDIPYLGAKRYLLTLIDENPDSDIVCSILELPYCSFSRSYIADGLCHFVFTLYF